MERFFRRVIVCVLVVGAAQELHAASLKVSPARFIVHDVKPGESYDIYKATGLRVTIYNDDDTTRVWLLSSHRPSERGRWEKGYAEIPNARWCWFDKNEITVSPKSVAYANLHLKLPGEEKYYNQHWVVTLGIDGKPGPGGIALAADIRVQIETESKTDVKSRPDGLLGLKPSAVRFEKITPGQMEKAQTVLCNNDTTTNVYAVSSLVDKNETTRQAYLTQSYEAIPDSKWIGRTDKITVGPGGSGTLDLSLAVPDSAAHFGKKWEDILLIQSDKGLAGFVRVRVQTKTGANAK